MYGDINVYATLNRFTTRLCFKPDRRTYAASYRIPQSVTRKRVFSKIRDRAVSILAMNATHANRVAIYLAENPVGHKNRQNDKKICEKIRRNG